MSDEMTLWQLLNTPLTLKRNTGVDEDRRAHRLLRRHQVALRQVQRKRERLARQITRHVQRGEISGVMRCTGELSMVVEQQRILESLLPSEEIHSEVLVISSWMLRDSHRLCTESPDEGMHFIVGIEVEGMALATRIIPFPYSHRSVAAAVGEHRATHRICIDVHEAGHHLLALIHSHPGNGSHANHPSGEDMRTQRLWELTTRMVGGIWSRDGHLRFFSANRPIAIRVVGHMMEKIDENLYRMLQAETPVEMHTPEAGL